MSEHEIELQEGGSKAISMILYVSTSTQFVHYVQIVCFHAHSFPSLTLEIIINEGLQAGQWDVLR